MWLLISHKYSPTLRVCARCWLPNKFPIVTLIKLLCVPRAHLCACASVWVRIGRKYSDINWHASLAQVLKCLRLQVCNTFAPTPWHYLAVPLCFATTHLLAVHDISIFIFFLSSRFVFGIISYWFYRLSVCVSVFVSLSFNDSLGFALSLPSRCRFRFRFSFSLSFSFLVFLSTH